jgi:hypothetical protein
VTGGPPPDSADSDVTVRASIGGGRLSRLVGVGEARDVLRLPEDEPDGRVGGGRPVTGS